MAKKKREKAPPQGLTKAQKRSVANVALTAFMFVTLSLVLYAVVFRGARRPSAAQTRQADAAAATAQRNRSECPTRAGEPWEYDRDTRCFFNPAPGHGHWDLGKPPGQSERARLMAGQAAAPSPAPAAPSPTADLPPGASNDE
jgi:hypothetical protein